MDYQKYLKEKGASLKLVRMGAVNEEIYKLRPNEKQITLDEEGNIILMLDSLVVKFSLDGDGAKIEKKKIDSKDNRIELTYIDEFGMGYLSGYYEIGKKISKYAKIEETNIDKDFGYKIKEGSKIVAHDDAWAITIQEGDWGSEYYYDGSCLLQYFEKSDYLNEEVIEMSRLVNMTKTIIKYPLSIGYYLNNGYITRENMNEVLMNGISKIIESYRKFIVNNGKQKYPRILNGILNKTEEEIKQENDVVEKEINYYLEVLDTLKNGDNVLEITESYSKEIIKSKVKR